MVYTFQLSGKFKIHVLVQKIVYHVTIKIEYIVYFLIHFSDMVCQKIMTQKTKSLVIYVTMKTASIAEKLHLPLNLSLISHIM